MLALIAFFFFFLIYLLCCVSCAAFFSAAVRFQCGEFCASEMTPLLAVAIFGCPARTPNYY